MTSQMMTTEQLRTQRKPDDVEASFNTYRGFQAMSHMAESLANSTIIPEAFRNTIMVKDGYDQRAKKWNFRPEPNPNGVSNCIIALNMAQRLGADPMMIMQNLYLVDGRPSWSSQFIIAAINSSGRYSPLRFDITGGEEEVEIPYAVTEWVYSQASNKKEPVESNQVAHVKNYKCVAWVIEKATGERLESTPITMEMAVKEGWYQKNGSKWQTMPEQMLRYRAASFFGRIYAPDLLMGLRTQEEEHDAMIDVTPEPMPQEEPTTLANIAQNVIKKSTADDQNQTSNDVEEKTVSTKKPEPVQEEAPPVEEVQVKKPTSAELKKSFAKSLNNAKSEREVSAIESQITANFDISEADKKYLEANIQQAYDRLKPAESSSVNELIELQKEAEAAVQNLKSTKPVINEIKSNNIKNGLAGQIQDAKDITALEAVAQRINESKPQMTSAHQQEVLVIYAQRKEILSQADIFGAKEDNTPVARAIARINKCQSQDEINLVWAEIENDPYVSSALTDADRKLIEEAADRREAELQG